jgi:hypothetical protein
MRAQFPSLSLFAAALMGLSSAGEATLHGTWQREVRAELAKPALVAPAVMDEAALAALPIPVRNYFRKCRFAGRPSMRNARVTWDEFSIRMGRGKGWMNARVEQFNAVADPTRLVYMHSRIAGILPFNGRDKYQDGHGNMLIRAMGFIKIADSKSRHMDQSALATFLAEIPWVPSAALQPYVRWEHIDGLTARAVMTHAGNTVSGIFRFDDAGDFLSFETGDRWQDGKEDAPIPWIIRAAAPRDLGGFSLPTEYTATWREPEGDFEYFRGRLGMVEYNVEEP